MKRSTILIGLAIFLLCCLLQPKDAAAQQKSLEGYKIYKINVNNQNEYQELLKFRDALEVNYLRISSTPGQSFDVAVAPEFQERFEAALTERNLKWHSSVNNLQSVVHDRWNDIISTLFPSMEWTQYHSHDAINKWIENMSFRYPFIVNTYAYVYSYEWRITRLIRYSRQEKRKAIFIEANANSMEWMSSAVSTCFLNNLLKSKDAEIKRISWDYDWVIIPVNNADGFVYAHEVDPLWRKSRYPSMYSNEETNCIGADITSNFEYGWKAVVDDPCNQRYSGYASYTEREAHTLTTTIKAYHPQKFRIFISLQSYGQMILLPYGNSTEHRPKNYDQMLRLSKAFADGAAAKYGTQYTYGSDGEMLHPTSGSAKDWAHGVWGIPYAATILLPEYNDSSYFTPPERILPICEEFTDGMLALIQAAEKENLFDGDL